MGLAEKRIHLDARQRVDGIAHSITGMGIAAHAVLGAEQRHELDARRLVQDVDGALEVVVDAAGVSHQPDALALQRGKPAVAQHLDTRLDDRPGRHRHHHTHYQKQYLLHLSTDIILTTE